MIAEAKGSGRRRPYGIGGGGKSSAGLAAMRDIAIARAMADKVQQDEKARRLAEQLRANLRRRKAQGREMKTGAPEKDKD